MILPSQTVPSLEVPTLDQGNWNINGQHPAKFMMVVFYRGLHCPLCGVQLKEFEAFLDEFENLNVAVIAISTDSQKRARQSQQEWQLQSLNIGYGLDLKTASEWGLYLSKPREMAAKEVANFSEPGIFIIKQDKTLYGAIVQTMPFTRPAVKDLIRTLAYVIANDYPVRGGLTIEQALA